MLKKLLIIMLCVAMLVTIAIGCKPAAEEAAVAEETGAETMAEEQMAEESWQKKPCRSRFLRGKDRICKCRSG